MNNILGTRIKSLREKANMTQLEFARQLNVGNTTISQYESGQRVPSDDIKIKIATFFGVTVDYLLGNEQNTSNTIVTDEDIRFALFGGDSKYVSDEAFEDVKRFAEIVAEKERKKNNEKNPN